MELHHHLSPDDGELLEDPGHYQRLLGKLNYLTIPRPDLSYAVGVVSQFMHAPRRSHLEAVHRILRKSNHLDEGGILYAPYASKPQNSDADWAGSPSDRRSTSGYCTQKHSQSEAKLCVS